jgi:4-amino-4-deoxy-L-arabinose transferase-like glycosyltransferase
MKAERTKNIRVSKRRNESRNFWHIGILVAMLLLGFAIRIYDITDLPLDFHPTAQICRAITARGLYYSMQPNADPWKREQAIIMWKVEKIEPPGIDGLAAVSWLIAGEEILWLPRLYSVIFWLIGGIGLYLLGKDLISRTGGLIALGVYLFLPFGIIASRTFIPDPLMIALNIFGWWAMYRWYKQGTWKWAILAGILCGLAIFVKALAAFAVIAGFIGLLLLKGFKSCVKDRKFWVMGLLAVFPETLFIIYGFFRRCGSIRYSTC